VPRFIAALAETARHVEAHLESLVNDELARGAPKALCDAMRHAVLAGGKRFRPFLAIETAALFGVPTANALEAAAAIECIHCYSLVHDDLPSMDNDEMRRGRPTVWKAFGEATAILVGDALQALAFERLSMAKAHDDPDVRTRLIKTLAIASGAPGMVGGQLLDLTAGESVNNDEGAVARLQAMKTGALIRAACEMGAILGKAADNDHTALERYGNALGLAFQISDDLLDAEGSAATVGKATGKDVAAGKATLVSLLGRTRARATLNATVANAVDALKPFGDEAERLRDAARFMGRRES
jgi:farnesyl diphosphate synthase